MKTIKAGREYRLKDSNISIQDTGARRTISGREYHEIAIRTKGKKVGTALGINKNDVDNIKMAVYLAEDDLL